MKQVLCIFLLSIVFLSCEDNKSGTVRDRGFEFEYIDAEGRDLFDPTTPNYYSVDDIRMYYLVDGVWKTSYESHLDFPHQFHLDDQRIVTERIYLAAFLSDSFDGNFSETYLDFGDHILTIRAEFDIYKSSFQLMKAWVNGEPVIFTGEDLPVFVKE